MKDTKEKALEKAKRLCSCSEKSAKDIREKLKQWGITADGYDFIIASLYEEKFLDDLRYAQSYAHDKIYLSKWGKQKVYFALKIKEIPEEAIEEALAAIEQQRYEENLKDLLEAKKKSVKANTDYEKMAKLIRFGQSRGFTMTEINKTLNEIV